MSAVPPLPLATPLEEAPRQLALDAYAILDTAPEQAYDDIVRLAATLCETPAAAISLIDRERQWFKARIGIEDAQTPRSEAVCDRAIRNPHELLVVEDFRAQAGIPAPPLRIGGRPVRFYAGMPLLSPEGHALGTVCVMDVRSRRLSAGQREGLGVLARQTGHLLELRRYALEQRRLLAEREAFARRLEASREDLQRRHDQLQHSATHDALTGLLNRTALSQLHEDPGVAERLARRPYTLMLLDIDHFKQVNDRYGHLLGDRALRAVADAVAASVRHGDFAARYGGEEFLILLPDTRLDDAAQVAERIRGHIAQAALPFPLTVSIGLAMGEPGRDWSEQVFVRADQALYRAKAAGRNRVVADDTPWHHG
ncbi:sensor domain-containing diguanylate cyclase [Vulcaniibacterium tengchongense]|uniref:diguanylate cyclase n=1 Tax=Vulcaniibacterium tengchongense TaxID=1273429 RepID=A0A3N4VCW5_9GAMM|nr:sensor domain-containing diguanylate cyclase [Vulcaniibacterium tengchongense]RPE79653.1 diguanylate cyclase with GAF sensor [Vulcaniibacterium tengchongense]